MPFAARAVYFTMLSIMQIKFVVHTYKFRRPPLSVRMYTQNAVNLRSPSPLLAYVILIWMAPKGKYIANYNERFNRSSYLDLDG